MKKIFLLLLISLFILSFKLTKIPDGLTIDEASFGYNAILLSRTLHDENGRFLPLFVLSINKSDWRQPVYQYFLVALFKIFNPSIFMLRFASVIIAILSIYLIYLFSGIYSAILLLTTPVFLMHSHMGLDNIAPIPFILIWLINIFKYSKNKKIINLIIASIALGIGFYSYKGIRIFVPIYILTSSFLIYSLDKKIKNLIIYLGVLSPFFLVIPYLELKYSGAVLAGTTFKFPEISKFLFRFLSSFDLSFLFVKGDEMLIHSTGQHGMFLLSSLPFFIYGIFKSWKLNKFNKFLIVTFFLSPILFGFIGTIHRASRMLSILPFYIAISTIGINSLLKEKKKIAILLLIIYLFNFLIFLNYYWTGYSKDTKHLFFNMENGLEYKLLKEKSKELNLIPYVDKSKTTDKFIYEDFIRSIYFTNKPNLWEGDINKLPNKALLMTDDQNITGLNKADFKYANFVYYIKP